MPGASSYDHFYVSFVVFCCFWLFLGEARRGEAEAEAEAEARPRRGEARRRQGDGGAAAGINDAFLRPHANFQFF